MKTIISLLTLILAATVAAQTVEPTEHVYGPFVPGPRDPSFSVAVTPHGMLLAWSEVDPETGLSVIHTGLLDLDAQLVAPIRKIVPFLGSYAATNPQTVTNGDTFFLTWLERDRYNYGPRGVSGVILDAAGARTSQSRSFGAAGEGPPGVMWDGLAYRLYDPRRVPFATPEANGWVDWSDDCTWCRYHRGRYMLTWTIITPEWVRTGGHIDFDYDSPAPAVTATGNDLVIVWSTNIGLKALRVVDGKAEDAFFLHSRDAAESAPSMAGSLVVFAQGGDIFGSLVTGDAFGTPFPISAGPELDKLPRVYAAGGNRYLVTYIRETHPSAVSLVGRFVRIP
jgi:hypothetical protein